ncbi:threonylcarbamoyl-AMP synthase [Patescibacteria group bacterium]|nr:threonylcarbamoyl-AMP synthase [Patescibacteria group bacterium]
MQILNLTSNSSLKFIAHQAAEVLGSGGIIVYPTETAYGLGGKALDETVIKNVFAIKQRPLNKPIHIIVKDIQEAKNYAEVTKEGIRLARRFFPGPLTLIFKKKFIIPDVLTGGLDTIGIRIPNHPVVIAISNIVSFPFTATSANFSGRPAPYSTEDVFSQFTGNEIDLVIDAGSLPQTLPSTVVDLTVAPFKIIREGPISRQQIENVL